MGMGIGGQGEGIGEMSEFKQEPGQASDKR